MQIATRYRDAFVAVQQLVDTNEIVRDEFRLEFKVEIKEQGFSASFFEAVSQGNIGTFYGVEEGSAKLDELLKRQSFTSSLRIARWLRTLTNAMQHDLRQPERPKISLGSILKKGLVSDGNSMTWSSP